MMYGLWKVGRRRDRFAQRCSQCNSLYRDLSDDRWKGVSSEPRDNAYVAG